MVRFEFWRTSADQRWCSFDCVREGKRVASPDRQNSNRTMMFVVTPEGRVWGVASAARHHKITRATVRSRIRKGSPGWRFEAPGTGVVPSDWPSRGPRKERGPAVSGDYDELPTARSTLRARYVTLLVWKAHMVLPHVTRVRVDGSPIEVVSAFYALTRTPSGWKFFALSDRSHSIRRNQLGNARKGCCRASFRVGSGSVPKLRQCCDWAFMMPATAVLQQHVYCTTQNRCDLNRTHCT
jgi:hypothetical protein